MSNQDCRIHCREELAALPLERLDHEIARCLWGYQNGGAAQGRKAIFKRLIEVEAIREEVHGVPAKSRRFNAR